MNSSFIGPIWKQANIFLLLKNPSADPKVPANYRPISLLPSLSKALEKNLNRVISDYAENNNLLHITQSGFRANYSTETALLDVTEHIKEMLDQGGKAILILLDLSAAFNMVPQDRLLERMSDLGIGVSVLAWLASFLEERNQEIWPPPFASPHAQPEREGPSGLCSESHSL